MVITNPIVLGEAIDEKDFFLDINVVLNNNSIINLEMQVINEHNWPERSLSYHWQPRRTKPVDLTTGQPSSKQQHDEEK